MFDRAAPEYVAAFREIIARIQAAVAGNRKALREPLGIYVAGGAAAHFYTGARVSEDIDAALSRRVLLPGNLEVSYRGRDGTPRLLYFDRQYNDALSLLHEDAYRDSVPIELEGIDRRRIDLRLLSPTDLVVSKLARFHENDRRDVAALAQAGLVHADEVRARAGEALAGYIGGTGMVEASIREACALIAANAPRRTGGRR